MGNGMGSLYVASSGLQNSQNALNTTANNLSNVDTEGYVRQQVLFQDRNYTTFNTTAAISNQQAGLGVTIADVVHTRDIFLDKYYRSESGRQAFYQACSDTATELETFYQELEGATFQSALIGDDDGNDGSFWAAIEELAKDPSSDVKQNLVIQKASLALTRAQAVKTGLQEYQTNLNSQISDDIDTINTLGRTIKDLNLQIQTIEAGGLETAMTLRDQRDIALDQLGALANISYKENVEGVVTVKLEGVDFVDENNSYTIGKNVDKTTGFITPYWTQLSNPSKGEYSNVYNYSTDISTELNTDIGELKAKVLARGDRIADYRDVEGLTANQYNNSTADHVATGMSILLSAEAGLDQMMHEVITGINDALCPNTTTTIYGADGTTPLTYIDPETGDTKSYSNVMVWDKANASVGADGEPYELFVRRGVDRYTKVVGYDASGKENTFYVYNEEDTSDPDTMYTLDNLEVNADLLKNGSLMAAYTVSSGAVETDYALGNKLAAVFSDKNLTLSPNDTTKCSVKTYYANMIGAIGTDGNVYSSVASSLSNTVSSVETQRQSVIGVSSDEELTNMVKYQNAYNASSRFMNVVSEMLEYLITQLG